MRVMLHGLSGPITINDTIKVDAPMIMPGLAQNPTIKDKDLAAIATFIRNSWGNQATPLKADDFKKAREATKDRALPYTENELALSSAQTTAEPSDGEWVNLIDGNLDHFVKRGGKVEYELKAGILIGKTRPKTPNTFLCTAKNYADFELEYEFKVAPKLNSGVQIRSNLREDKKTGLLRVWGYQCEIDPSERPWSAGIYEEGGRGWLACLYFLQVVDPR